MEPGQMNDYGDVATEPRQQMAKERRPALAVIGLFIAGIGVVLLLIVTFMFLTGTTGGLRKSVLNSLEQSADEQEVYRSEVENRFQILEEEVERLKEEAERRRGGEVERLSAMPGT